MIIRLSFKKRAKLGALFGKNIVALDARLIGTQNTGDSTYWRGLLHGFAKLQPEVKLLLFSNKPAPEGLPQAECWEWVHLPGDGARWWSLVRFPLAARKAGAQVIHTQYNLSPLAGQKGLITLHDVSFFIGPQWFRPRDRFLLQRFVPSSARRARLVLTVSETSKREIEHWIPAVKGKLCVTPNALNPAILPMPTDAAQALLKGRLGLEKPYLLSASTLWPRKNMALAIEAAQKLPENMPHKLVLAGKKGWGDLPSDERLLMLGYVSNEELSALYTCADLYLAPSWHEGFGLPLLEAFACGCPVLCSQGGAMPEIAGDAAEVEPTWEPEHWANTIATLLGDSGKLEQMRQKGYARLAHFDWKTTAQLTLAAYQEVIG